MSSSFTASTLVESVTNIAVNIPTEAVVATSADADGPFVVHVLATPRWAAVTRFQAALQRTLAEHPDVPVQVSGAAKNDSHLELTFGVSMGPASTVSDWSEESLAGFALIHAFMDEMLDYTPRFVGQPDAAHADAAVAVAPHFGLSTNLPALAARAA